MLLGVVLVVMLMVKLSSIPGDRLVTQSSSEPLISDIV